MFEKSAATRHKNSARVMVTLAGQEPIEAFVFVKVGERLIDLLNDDRKFIPIRRLDGVTVITSKLNIVAIIEKAEEPEVFEAAPPGPHSRETTEEAGAPRAEAPKDAAPENPEPEPSPTPEPDPETKSQAGCNTEEEVAEGDDVAKGRGKRARRNFDPYDVLRVSREATIEEIKRAYHTRMKAVHPDTIAALDLDEDLAKAANISAQRVNRAYRMLAREKHDAAKSPEPV